MKLDLSHESFFQMQSIFQNHTSATQTKHSIHELIKIQLKSYLQHDDDFDNQFCDAANHIFVCGKKDPRVDQLVKLVVSFLLSFRDPLPRDLIDNKKYSTFSPEDFHEYQFKFSEDFVRYILECSRAGESIIRQRSTQMIGELMQQCSEEYEFRFDCFLFF